MTHTPDDIAALETLARAWLTARPWRSLESLLSPPPVDAALLETLTDDAEDADRARAGAPDFQAPGKPFGFGLDLRWLGGEPGRDPAGRRTVARAAFEVGASLSMNPGPDDGHRETLTFALLREERGAWKVAALLTEETRSELSRLRARLAGR